MTRYILSLGMACVLATAAHAQTTTRQQQAARPVAGEARSTTLIGCLQAGPQPNSFVLNVTTPAQTSRTTSGAVGTTGAPATTSRVRLVGGHVDVGLYVGRRVEVSGMMVERTLRRSRATAGTTGTGRQSFVNVQRLTHLGDCPTTANRGRTGRPARR